MITIANKLKRGRSRQLKTGRKPFTACFSETGQAVYKQNRKNCGAINKLLVAMEFVDFACEKILDQDWSPDTVVRFSKQHIDQSKLNVRNIDLSMKTKLNTKKKRVRKYCRFLGKSIAERPVEVEDRMEFGHWKFDTVEDEQSDDNALLTLIEHKTRNYYVIKIDDQDHDSGDYAITKLHNAFGNLFP